MSVPVHPPITTADRELLLAAVPELAAPAPSAPAPVVSETLDRALESVILGAAAGDGLRKHILRRVIRRLALESVIDLDDAKAVTTSCSTPSARRTAGSAPRPGERGPLARRGRSPLREGATRRAGARALGGAGPVGGLIRSRSVPERVAAAAVRRSRRGGPTTPRKKATSLGRFDPGKPKLTNSSP